MPTELKKWVKNQEKTKDHWLEIEDPEGWYQAIVKWDGCIHFWRCFNEPRSFKNSDNAEYTHICDIDDMISRLQALKQAALEHFGDTWPG